MKLTDGFFLKQWEISGTIKAVEVGVVSRKDIIIILWFKRSFLIISINRDYGPISLPTSSVIGPLRLVFVQQTASVVVASFSSCDVTGFAVVTSRRSMRVANVIAMGPAVVVL